MQPVALYIVFLGLWGYYSTYKEHVNSTLALYRKARDSRDISRMLVLRDYLGTQLCKTLSELRSFQDQIPTSCTFCTKGHIFQVMSGINGEAQSQSVVDDVSPVTPNV